jgi:hypothetical protein
LGIYEHEVFMAKNAALNKAAITKADEFYTQLRQ